MQIGAITQVLIRMELDHVSEWLLHMQKLGFDKIWVFYEEQVVDARVGQDSPSPNWAKKPEADFHPELSDEEALQKFQEIIDQIHGIDIFLIPSTSRAEHNGKRQIDNLIWLCKKIQTKEFPLIDWLAFLDIDELIVCKQPLKSYLSNPSQKRVSVINIPQRLMASRWEGGKARCMSGIGSQYGLIEFNNKLIFRPNKFRANKKSAAVRVDVHNIPPRLIKGGVSRADPRILCFHHFRGRPQTELRDEKQLRCLRLYSEITEQILEEPNFDHINQFDNKLKVRPMPQVLHAGPFQGVGQWFQKYFKK